MKILLEHHSDFTTVHLSGDFDGLACRDFLHAVDLLTKTEHLNLVLNLEAVRSLNSTAIGACIRSSKSVQRAGGAMVIAGPSNACRQPLEALGIDRVIPIFKDVFAASGHFSGGADAPQTDRPEAVSDGKLTVLFSPIDPALNDALCEEEKRSGGIAKPRRGQGWRGVGHMAELGAESMRFDWDTAANGIAPERAKSLFTSGTELEISFTMSLLEKKRHIAQVGVVETSLLDDTLTIVAQYGKLEEETRRAIQRYVADIAYLRKEVRKPTQGKE